jgi:hypothetical protein
MPLRPRQAALIAVLATALAAVGCGGSARPDGGALRGLSKPAARARLEQLERQASLTSLGSPPRRAPAIEVRRRRRAPRAISAPRTVALRVASPPPRRPYAGGPLTATYHITLRGGDALVPPGPYPNASGSVLLRIYGHTETCWTFRNLQGVRGPRLAGIALGADGAQGIISLFTPTFAAHGCQTDIPASTLKSVQRRPRQYSVLVEDHSYVPSLVGAL